jgi:uncharacterized membrane protein
MKKAKKNTLLLQILVMFFFVWIVGGWVCYRAMLDLGYETSEAMEIALSASFWNWGFFIIPLALLIGIVIVLNTIKESEKTPLPNIPPS